MKTIIWYWSLLCENSAKLTCEILNFNHWYIKWYTRIFNKIWYNPHIKKYNEDTSMLNIQKENNNNVMIISYFNVTDQDYKKIRLREWDYNEVEVDIYDLDKIKIWKWIIFISKESVQYKGENKQLLFTNLHPEQRYINICLDAIKQTPYLQDFLDTTYMSCWKQKFKLDN